MSTEARPGKYPDRNTQLFYELARDRHAAQADALGALDTKLAFFLTSSSALLGILLAVYALRSDALHVFEWLLVGLSASAWILITGFALDAFRHRPWSSGPQLQQVFDDHFGERDDNRIRWGVANRFWGDYNRNKEHEVRKGRALTVALLLFVTQTAVLVLGLVLVVVSGSSESSRQCRNLGPAARVSRPPPTVRHRTPEANYRAALARLLACQKLGGDSNP